VALALLIVRPAKAFIDVGSYETVADGVDGFRTEPGIVTEGLVPAAREDVVFAVRAMDDLPVPVVPQLHGGIFEAVLLIVRADCGHSPGSSRQWGEDRRWLKVVDKGLAGGSGALRETVHGASTDSGCTEKNADNHGREQAQK
jgi:hypothetical protein